MQERFERHVVLFFLIALCAVVMVQPALASIGGNNWSPIGPSPIGNLFGGVTETTEQINLGALSCLEADSPDTNTSGNEDPVNPTLGAARIYFVEYDDGRRVSYGTETARKPRLPSSGDCP